MVGDKSCSGPAWDASSQISVQPHIYTQFWSVLIQSPKQKSTNPNHIHPIIISLYFDIICLELTPSGCWLNFPSCNHPLTISASKFPQALTLSQAVFFPVSDKKFACYIPSIQIDLIMKAHNLGKLWLSLRLGLGESDILWVVLRAPWIAPEDSAPSHQLDDLWRQMSAPPQWFRRDALWGERLREGRQRTGKKTIVIGWRNEKWQKTMIGCEIKTINQIKSL